MHLACTADAVGLAEPSRTHRPLSAKDLLLGTHATVADASALAPWESRVYAMR